MKVLSHLPSGNHRSTGAPIPLLSAGRATTNGAILEAKTMQRCVVPSNAHVRTHNEVNMEKLQKKLATPVQ